MPPSLVVRVAGNLDQLKKDMKEGEATIKATSAQMEKLTKSFSGERLITHAKNVTAAIREVGVTTLTASQSARNLDLLERAMDKMRRTSEPIPESMKRTAEQLRFMARTAEEAAPAGQKVTAAYREVDGVLQSLGINIGPYVKGLEDITGLVTKGVGPMGLLGYAAAGVGTAIAAWQFGKKIGEVTGLTEAIARQTAILKGWGDVALEENLARLQSIELAGRAQAMWKLQAEGTAAATKAAADHTAQMQREGMVGANNAAAMEGLANQLAKVKTQREADAAAARNQWPAIEGVTERTNLLTEALKRQEQSVKETMTREAERQAQIDAFMNAPTLNQRVNESTSYDIGPMSAAQMAQMNDLYAPAAGTHGFSGENAGLRFRLQQLEEMMAGGSQIKSREQYVRFLSNMNELMQIRQTLPGFAGGVKNFSGGPAIVGERGPELVNLPRGADVIPNHAMGGTVTNHFHLNLSGLVGEPQQVARAVMDLITREFKPQMRLPAGA